MPPPAKSSSNRAEVDVGERFEDDLSESPTSSSVQAQMLLKALYNVIVPLVQAALPNKTDLHEDPFGPEAENFLDALQKYIGSIVRDQSRPNSEEVNLEEPEPPATLLKTMDEKASSEDMKDNNTDSSPSWAGFKRTINLEDENSMIPRNVLDYKGVSHSHEDRLRDTLWGDALTILRAHVFNTMPIRLLCFEKHGQNLDITLLDRTGIYSYLIQDLRANFDSTYRKPKSYRQGDDLRNTYTRKFTDWTSEIGQYTILSHTWLRSAPGEVTFGDWYHGDFDLTHPGYQKLVNFCRVAAEEHQVTLGWMDTVCIDKESSAELDESIRSMYKWYQNAKNCIIYLAETTKRSNMYSDPWFTRGWTLQELLAPRYITFYNKGWKVLGNGSFDDKEDANIQYQIKRKTTITPTELIAPLSETTISRRMEWAANRQVTRGEDSAYSLMGIFNVSVSIAYGEGADLAFIRLVKEILNTAKSDVLDLFNWAGNHNTDASALIPSSSAAYVGRREFNFRQGALIEPLTLTHLGLRIPIVLMPATPYRPGMQYTPPGDYSSTLSIDSLSQEEAVFRSYLYATPNSPSASMFSHEGTSLGLAFAVLNCGGSSESTILLFKCCFAIAILYSHDNGIAAPLGYKRKITTKKPISFELKNRNRTPKNNWEYDTVPKQELARHGMQFLTMYL